MVNPVSSLTRTHFVRANPHITRIFGLDKQNACPHNVFMSRSPSSIAVQSPIRTPCGSLPPGLSSKCPVNVKILFSLCPVSVQNLTSESEPPAMRLYEVDSFSSFRRRLRTPSRILDTWKLKVGTRESLILQPCHALDGQRPTVQRCLVDGVSGTTSIPFGGNPSSFVPSPWAPYSACCDPPSTQRR